MAVIFRDEERGSKVLLHLITILQVNKWRIDDSYQASVGSWEPTYDTELWKKKKQLNLFVQYTDQKDGEGKADIAPQPVKVLEIKIK